MANQVTVAKDHGYKVGDVVVYGGTQRITAVSGTTLTLEPFNFAVYKAEKEAAHQAAWDALKAAQGNPERSALTAEQYSERAALTNAFTSDLDSWKAKVDSATRLRVVTVTEPVKAAKATPVKEKASE